MRSPLICGLALWPGWMSGVRLRLPVDCEVGVVVLGAPLDAVGEEVTGDEAMSLRPR